MLLGGVLYLRGCLGGWFVSSGLDMNARIHGLTAEYCSLVS